MPASSFQDRAIAGITKEVPQQRFQNGPARHGPPVALRHLEGEFVHILAHQTFLNARDIRRIYVVEKTMSLALPDVLFRIVRLVLLLRQIKRGKMADNLDLPISQPCERHQQHGYQPQDHENNYEDDRDRRVKYADLCRCPFNKAFVGAGKAKNDDGREPRKRQINMDKTSSNQ